MMELLEFLISVFEFPPAIPPPILADVTALHFVKNVDIVVAVARAVVVLAPERDGQIQ